MSTFKIVPVLALFMGLSTFAFAGAPKDGANNNAKTTAKTEVVSTSKTVVKSGDQQYYWYTADGSTFLNYGTEPSTGCTAIGVGCAKGYIDQPGDPVNDPENTDRKSN